MPRKAKIYIAIEIFGRTFLTTEICGMSARFCMLTDVLNFPYLKSMSITWVDQKAPKRRYILIIRRKICTFY